MKGNEEKKASIEKATVEYLNGSLSAAQYAEIIKANGDRPNYERIAEEIAKRGSRKSPPPK